MLAGGLTSKVLGLLGTLLVVRYVAPDDYGEALVTAIVVGTASTFSSLGIGQFVIVRAGGRPDLTFHATVFQMVLGLLAAGIVVLFQEPLGAWANAPAMGRYVPALVLSMLLDRVWLVPERMLMRDMRFRRVAMARSGGELAYTGTSVVLAVLGWGGMAIALGNVARSLVRAMLLIPSVSWRDWLLPTRLRLDAVLSILRFGAPLAVGAIAGFIASQWDDLLVSGFYGPATMGAYHLAYSLSGMAAALVAEHIIDILVPSFTRTDPARRPAALLRGAALVTVLAMPFCIGLAVVAPTVVTTVLHPRWAEVAPMLTALSLVATAGPITWLMLAYLQACDRSTAIMKLLIFTAVAVIGCVSTLGRISPLWVCAAVGIGAFSAVLWGAFVVRALDGTPVTHLLATHVGPLLACVPLVGAVLGTRWLLARAEVDVRYLNLAIEVVAGAAAYVIACFVVARPVTRDFLGLLRSAFLRRGAGS